MSILIVYQAYDLTMKITQFLSILTLFIFGIMFALILIIVYAKLTDYVESQHENIRIIHILVASESDLYELYMRLPINVSMISIIVSFVIRLCILFFMYTGYYLTVNLTTIDIHLIIAMLILIAFNVPVHFTLKKIEENIMMPALLDSKKVDEAYVDELSEF